MSPSPARHRRARRSGIVLCAGVGLAALVCLCSRSAGGDEAVALDEPYENPLHAKIRFPDHSYMLLPWRAYMDTWPTDRLRECVGVNFNPPINHLEWADPLARLLRLAGVRSARVEVGWGALECDDPSRFVPREGQRVERLLKALRANGIRPLIILNANSGWPCPIKTVDVRLAEAGKPGDRRIVLEPADVAKIKSGYTGPKGQGYQIAFPLIVSADAETGACDLSAPLTKPIPAGPLRLYILRYKPFSNGTVLADGTKLPDTQATYDGWRDFVKTTCTFARDVLGTKGKSDSGFDVEIWNEYTFGSQFFVGDLYYQPRRAFKDKVKYESHGRKAEGREIILPIAVDYLTDPANGFAGVRVISGLANQRPFDNAAALWPGQAGFSRHYYVGANPGAWDNLSGALSPAAEAPALRKFACVDAQGKRQFWPYFVPTTRVSLPEFWGLAMKAEYMSRDLQPFPSEWKGHFRYARRGPEPTGEVWMTEYNFDRHRLAESLVESTGVAKDDPTFIAAMDRFGAKALLRSLVFWSHKGLTTINYFSPCWPIHSLGLIRPGFYERLDKGDSAEITDADLLSDAGEQMQLLHRLTSRLKTPPLEVTRPLTVESLVEHGPRLVFKGNGTKANPDRYNRDFTAILPFQTSAKSYAVACYVMTLDVLKVWNPKAGALDMARYDMPPQNFDVTLGNVDGEGATVSLWDPLTDRSETVEVLKRTATTLAVRLPLVDYPRFLMIDEAQPGPLIEDPVLKRETGGATLSFSTNLDGKATVTWGLMPGRTSGGRREVAVCAGQPASVAIPSLAEGQGVRVSFEHDGLKTWWPRWKHDPAGVLWPTTPVPTQSETVPTDARLVELPALPKGRQAVLRTDEAVNRWKGGRLADRTRSLGPAGRPGRRTPAEPCAIRSGGCQGGFVERHAGLGGRSPAGSPGPPGATDASPADDRAVAEGVGRAAGVGYQGRRRYDG